MKTILITGASRGNGRELHLALARAADQSLIFDENGETGAEKYATLDALALASEQLGESAESFYEKMSTNPLAVDQQVWADAVAETTYAANADVLGAYKISQDELYNGLLNDTKIYPEARAEYLGWLTEYKEAYTETAEAKQETTSRQRRR